ncbi:hypothetical protein ACQ4PT_024542 [Festuca glaucescens]
MASSSASLANHSEYLSETSSRFLMDTVTVTHNFEVTGYSLLDGMGAGEYITSSTFSAGGYDWNVMFFPDGNSEEEDGYASAYLNLGRGEPPVRVKYTLSLLDIDGGPIIRRRAITHTFTSAYSWGYALFFEKPEAEPEENYIGDSFIIRCVLTVMTQRTEDLSTVVVVPQSNLRCDLVKMLKDEESTDVSFIVGDRLFHAHRCMLVARSPIFKAKLLNETKENDSHRIKIDDMEPAIFGALLHFVYTDTIPDNWSVDKDASFQHLFVAADRYGLDRLRATCEQKLCQNIDVHNVATRLALAEQHHCVQLKNACLGFMSSHGVLSAIQETDGFKHLTISCPSVLGEVVDKVAKGMNFK